MIPTVSRRDERLLKVRLWTSGNRVYDCQGTKAIGIILAALAEGANPIGAVRRANGVLGRTLGNGVESVSEQLRAIAMIEEGELSDWSRHLGHELDLGTTQTDGSPPRRTCVAEAPAGRTIQGVRRA